jgi:hypothetical protein
MGFFQGASSGRVESAPFPFATRRKEIMNTNVTFWVSVLVIAVGCSKKPSPLEIRVANIEARMDTQRQDSLKILDKFHEDEISYNSDITNLQLLLINENKATEALTDKLLDLEQQNRADIDKLMSNRVAPRYPVRYVAPTSPVAEFKHGMPVDVYDAIVSTAAKDWPGDYRMQEYQINEQTSAYRKLHP